MEARGKVGRKIGVMMRSMMGVGGLISSRKAGCQVGGRRVDWKGSRGGGGGGGGGEATP